MRASLTAHRGPEVTLLWAGAWPGELGARTPLWELRPEGRLGFLCVTCLCLCWSGGCLRGDHSRCPRGSEGDLAGEAAVCRGDGARGQPAGVSGPVETLLEPGTRVSGSPAPGPRTGADPQAFWGPEDSSDRGNLSCTPRSVSPLPLSVRAAACPPSALIWAPSHSATAWPLGGRRLDSRDGEKGPVCLAPQPGLSRPWGPHSWRVSGLHGVLPGFELGRVGCGWAWLRAHLPGPLPMAQPGWVSLLSASLP